MLPLAVAGVVVHLKFQGGEETVDQTVVLDEPVLNWKERLRGSGIVHAPACAVQIQFGGQEISSVDSLREHGVEAGAVLHCTVTSAFRLFFCTSMYIQQHHTEFSADTMTVCSSYHAECEIEVWPQETLGDVCNRLVPPEKAVACCLYQPGFVWFKFSPGVSGESRPTRLSASSLEATVESAEILPDTRLICERKHRALTARPSDVEVAPSCSA